MTTAEPRRITCKELIVELLCDYLDSTLDADSAAALERHLAICPPCRAYLATYRSTRAATARTLAEPMPEEMKARLRAFLLEQLMKRDG